MIKLITELITFNKKTKWNCKAEEFLVVLKTHHCSVFFREELLNFSYDGKELKSLALVEVCIYNLG